MKRLTRRSPLIALLVLCCTAAAQEPAKEAKKKKPVIEIATIDASTRAPTKREVKRLGLKFEVRARGQIVTDLVKGGAAAKSGLAEGDVIVSLGGVDVYSRDDIADVLRVSSPGQKVKTSIVRARTKKKAVVELRLGAKQVGAPKVATLSWDYASLTNLDAALKKARKKKKLILVGLSGAET